MRERAASRLNASAGAAQRGALWLAALAVAFPAACGGAPGARQLFDLVPATSIVAAAVDWRAVRADAELGRLIPRESVEELFGALGVASKEVDELVFFGDGMDARAGSTGVILRGQFDPGVTVEQLKGLGWREQASEEMTLYVSPNGGEYCAQLDDLLVAGSRSAVMAVLSRSGESLASNPTYEKLAAHLESSDAPVLIIVAAPQRVQDMTDAGLAISSAVLGFAQLDMVAGLVRQLGAVRGVGCALAHGDGGFPVELAAVMRDEDAAGLVSGTLNLAQGLASAAPSDADMPAGQREAFKNFRQMSVERDADVVSIKVVMTEAQLQAR